MSRSASFRTTGVAQRTPAACKKPVAGEMPSGELFVCNAAQRAGGAQLHTRLHVVAGLEYMLAYRGGLQLGLDITSPSRGKGMDGQHEPPAAVDAAADRGHAGLDVVVQGVALVVGHHPEMRADCW